MNTKYLVWIIIGIVLAALIVGVIAAGSPGEVRLKKIDEQRINTLQTLQWQVVSYWQNNEKLPKTIEELTAQGKMPPDPVTGEPYEYEVTGEKTFKLCATFTTKKLSTQGLYIPQNENWDHKAGYVCFERLMSEELYPFIRTGKPVPIY
ncbi:MAG: hypothetical protein A3H06_02315 [Candidatus Colwellbacteria bacterium RIFCSPLOWO2_12_FULL_44_13]|uniref:Type II secretion system protein GspG C-terminal domain-containing protein n=3 Tax=Candidatus Colwelliibacteriota TaxID=1817904 RepID=A0A1G1Z5J5_9BACT|nr:MAG: hypothetical protein A3F24_01385 [Candidatus Colwellbacteria bacterium RIFCSPHIGHO2_12_FULL_44_17]OGY59908.1 MAG: hypothetical protein A3I31_02000 [Candidatus Colwellbacteria bacterium RIFCSPLOWO2_02_FULL_44_20b]OGY61777.1 MAG: hypothetical protein A3H06_02315 [Candidatus Colwellbacteria bacterium RIFCSPLOWO2_12_FULL_44_13]